ncbi:uncharacterized protein PAN0_007c3095 [Moesziomyces antarcticus]|uniref:Uncharacterized protein n=2 Tax=Pseudozyma antarctica TaxID=84753 RepID=A0A5C3FPT4_PSEA2|nr:uncharacterized protein PAN0_007c3095 [Moesziomyces antarcticus]GAK64879.1 conserved hypothetical protein [Moesziomyces antarcticus]SPO46136.1 uncharacterized protein PSANT_03822 [Moesziomyces antarcticus]
MPGLQAATVSHLDESSITSRSGVYRGEIDTTWCIGSVPNGGYSLSIILNAVLAFMRTPEVTATNIKSIAHNDPLLLSATYIQAVTWTPYEVRVQVLKRGKSLSNLQADLYQDGVLRITTQVLVTDFETQKTAADRMKLEGGEHDPAKNGYTITDKSQWAPEFPLSAPEKCHAPRPFGNKAESGKTFAFGELITVSADPKHIHATKTSDVLSAGAYYALTPQPRLSLDADKVAKGRVADGKNLIPFFADMFLSPPMMLPGHHDAHWYPTLHLTVEFKRALPKQPVTRTATLSKGRFMINGQHESDTELWSHPDDQHLFNSKQATERRSWILAVARQTALVLPFAVNQNKTKAKL